MPELKNLMHGIDWPAGENPAGFLVQEKFNGCRVYWDGERLVSRHGRQITLPAAWAAMPGMPLDCELYAGPGSVLRCADAIKHDRIDSRTMQLVTFDAPGVSGGYLTRFSALQDACRNLGHIHCPPVTLCESAPHAAALLAGVHRTGGEGLILRQPGAPYTAGRVDTLRKLKRPEQLTASQD